MVASFRNLPLREHSTGESLLRRNAGFTGRELYCTCGRVNSKQEVAQKRVARAIPMSQAAQLQGEVRSPVTVRRYRRQLELILVVGGWGVGLEG
ncbi:hypothetical protein CRG98_020605 [Punica granatum]|uniref:Uncharacterized protein n=1 Tax=Punica granatum TaxID=22663 RepID=A0A2I0JRU3_PUNGR|nr:hypothetical protein CRG98_020605 [Punica granatum]